MSKAWGVLSIMLAICWLLAVPAAIVTLSISNGWDYVPEGVEFGEAYFFCLLTWIFSHFIGLGMIVPSYMICKLWKEDI